VLEGVGVAAQLARGGDCLFPVAVLLVDAQQLLARGAAHGLAGQQLDQDFLGAIDQPGLVEVLRQLEAHQCLLLVAEIRQLQHLLVQADGTVVLAAAAVQFAQAQLHFQRVRMGARHFRQRAGRDVGLVIDQRVQPLVKTGWHLACLFQYGAHVDARGQPAQTEKRREQQ